VINGNFSFSFIVPKDISYQYGVGKLSYYAENGIADASGFNNQVVIGGFSENYENDITGPAIELYMNDENFAYGGLTDENPVVFIKLSDASGVNTVGNGIGHDITGVLDEQDENTFVMNDFYEADLDSYQSGRVSYPLESLPEGAHQVRVKAWDVFNNSSEKTTEFIVASSAQMALAHVYNYPNPFTTRTEFMFEHNMASHSLDIKVEVFTVSGKRIKTIRQTIIPDESADICEVTADGSYRISGIEWDGKDDFGDPIGKGVYVYRITAKTDSGQSADKLVILK
jgi:hypothetical protein